MEEGGGGPPAGPDETGDVRVCAEGNVNEWSWWSGGVRGGGNIKVKILTQPSSAFPGFGADPPALLDKLSALTLTKAHPVPLTAKKKKKKKKKKRLFHLRRRLTWQQRSLLLGGEGGTLVIRSPSLQSGPGWKTADGRGGPAARSAWQAVRRRT